jgi:hypothetical protein
MIDSGLIGGWDPRVTDALDRFDQGDLIERPPFFYAASPQLATWETTKQFVSDEVDGEALVIEVDPADGPPYGIITTAGCDIADTGRKPWVQIAPVYPLDQITNASSRIGDIKRNAIPHFVLLDPPTLEGQWIADLRIEVPIEKSVLGGRTPILGFSTIDGRRHLLVALQVDSNARHFPMLSMRASFGRLGNFLTSLM